MILIISEEDDFSTNDVIAWLIYTKKAWIRINSNDVVTIKMVIKNHEKKPFWSFAIKK